jgi:hypothetical protein
MFVFNGCLYGGTPLVQTFWLNPYGAMDSYSFGPCWPLCRWPLF